MTHTYQSGSVLASNSSLVHQWRKKKMLLHNVFNALTIGASEYGHATELQCGTSERTPRALPQKNISTHWGKQKPNT